MNMPGFTAEASLFSVRTRYQATVEASFYGGIVQPAQVSDVFNPDRPVPFLSSHVFYPDRPTFCLKTRIFLGPNGEWTRLKVLGFWNPVTARCE